MIITITITELKLVQIVSNLHISGERESFMYENNESLHIRTMSDSNYNHDHKYNYNHDHKYDYNHDHKT